jgi:Fe-S cluster assembly scaffold protein SufB
MALGPKTVPERAPNPAGDLITRESVLGLSERLAEPVWLREKRLYAWEQYQAAPPPRWQRGVRGWWVTDLATLRLETMAAFGDAGVETALPEVGPEKDDQWAGVIAHRNATTAQSRLARELRQSGVYFADLSSAVHEQPELVRHYMDRLVMPDEGKFQALAAALWSNGVFVYVPEGVEVALPLRSLLSLESPDLALSRRTIIVAERASRVTYVEGLLSPACATGSLSAATIEVYVGAEAHLTYAVSEEWGDSISSVIRRRAQVEREGHLDWFVAYLGGGVSRTKGDTVLAGPGATTSTVGLFFADKRQRLDLDYCTSHDAPHTEGDTLLSGAVKDGAHAAFTGNVIVSRRAPQAQSRLASRTLTLGGEARVDALPSQEVQAGDARISHSATAEKLAEEQIFYLMTRGLSRQQATTTLVRAFFEPALASLPLEQLRERVERTIVEKLQG